MHYERENLKGVGIWGQRHYQYLKETKPSVIDIMRLKGNLISYLQSVNDQAEEMIFQLVKKMAKDDGVTEELKRHNQMAWVAVVNSIRNRAKEVVNSELINTIIYNS